MNNVLRNCSWSATRSCIARAPEVAISFCLFAFCLFEDLQAEGPFAPIFRDFATPSSRSTG